jgi:hypothetical protein
MFSPGTRTRARGRRTYCTPNYLGGDVVADNNADDDLPDYKSDRCEPREGSHCCSSGDFSGEVGNH